MRFVGVLGGLWRGGGPVKFITAGGPGSVKRRPAFYAALRGPLLRAIAQRARDSSLDKPGRHRPVLWRTDATLLGKLSALAGHAPPTKHPKR